MVQHIGKCIAAATMNITIPVVMVSLISSEEKDSSSSLYTKKPRIECIERQLTAFCLRGGVNHPRLFQKRMIAGDRIGKK